MAGLSRLLSIMSDSVIYQLITNQLYFAYCCSIYFHNKGWEIRAVLGMDQSCGHDLVFTVLLSDHSIDSVFVNQYELGNIMRNRETFETFKAELQSDIAEMVERYKQAQNADLN